MRVIILPVLYPYPHLKHNIRRRNCLQEAFRCPMLAPCRQPPAALCVVAAHARAPILLLGTTTGPAQLVRERLTRRTRFSRTIRSMRAVLQRVHSASVKVDGEVVSRIGPGLLCLIGLGIGDTEADAEYITRKLLNIRLWPNLEKPERAWDSSVLDNDFELLLVSQFTLFGRLKGNKIDYSKAMPPGQATEQYTALVERVRRAYRPESVKDGVFGAMMTVALENDGPVTVSLDSQARNGN